MSHSIIPKTPWTGKHLWSLEPLSVSILVIGLCLFGLGDACLVLAGLGAAPWTVFSQGMSLLTGISLGWVTFMTSAVVLLLWWPLKIRPGLGTVLNMIIIAFVLGLATDWLSPPQGLWPRILLCLLGIVLIGIASALYLTAHKGAGPRDGLLVGICQALGWRVGLVRTLIEVLVCFLGWLFGGVVGIGTLLFAFGVGWVMQFTLEGFRAAFEKKGKSNLERR